MSIDISRADIESNYLMDFDSETRFIKLPISGYMDLLGIEPNTSQCAIINAINKLTIYMHFKLSLASEFEVE